MNDNLPAKIIETPLNTALDIVLIRAYCKNCGSELIKTGLTLLSSSYRYQYRCEKCGVDFCSREEFPRVEYKTQDESEDKNNG